MVKKIALSTFVAALLLEVMVRVAPIQEKQKEVFSLSPVASLSKESWFAELMKEQESLHRRFQEYEIYSLEPYQGKHIRISGDGYRQTVNPVPSSQPVRVGLFGGSTMWGGWAREPNTIPSQLSQSLAVLPQLPSFEVINFGQVGYVFSQEVHQAFRILSSTKPSESPAPRVMVFLDGVCDALASMTNFMQGTAEPAGKPWEFEKYNYLFQMGKTGEIALYDVAKKSKAFRTMVRIAEKQGWKKPDKKNIMIQPTQEDLIRLAEQTGQAYLAILNTANKALKANGVKPIFILQPAFFAKGRKSEEERVLEKENAHWLPYVAQAYSFIQQRRGEISEDATFLDWSHLFDGDGRTLYADVMHYSETGNQVIGQAMAREIAPLLKELPPQKVNGQARL